MVNKLGLFGDMIVFSSYAMQVIMSFLMLAMIFMMLPRAQVSAKRICEVLDEEETIKENYEKSRRVYRGLFVSNNGTKINADVNGSYQITKKVFPNAYSNGIVGVGLHPTVVNIPL